MNGNKKKDFRFSVQFFLSEEASPDFNEYLKKILTELIQSFLSFTLSNTFSYLFIFIWRYIDDQLLFNWLLLYLLKHKNTNTVLVNLKYMLSLFIVLRIATSLYPESLMFVSCLDIDILFVCL